MLQDLGCPEYMRPEQFTQAVDTREGLPWSLDEPRGISWKGERGVRLAREAQVRPRPGL